MAYSCCLAPARLEDDLHGALQIGGDGVRLATATLRPGMLVRQENGSASSGSAALDVRILIADHPRSAQVHPVLGGRLAQGPRLGLPALAGSGVAVHHALGVVIAVIGLGEGNA